MSLIFSPNSILLVFILKLFLRTVSLFFRSFKSKKNFEIIYFESQILHATSNQVSRTYNNQVKVPPEILTFLPILFDLLKPWS